MPPEDKPVPEKMPEPQEWWLLALSIEQAAKVNWQDSALVRTTLAQAQNQDPKTLEGPFASYQEAEAAWRRLAWQSVDDADLCWRIVRG